VDAPATPDRQGRGRRPGLQTEVVLSLALVMLAATAILAVALLRWNDARWRDLLGHVLVAEARQAPAPELAVIAGTDWWRIRPDGTVLPASAEGGPLDPESRRLAEQAREKGQSLLRPGAAWDPIRFAEPISAEGDVAVARLPAAASLRLRAFPLAVVVGLLVVDVVVFTAFGATLLRGRLVAPLERLATAVRGLADGAFEARVAEEGAAEIVAVAAAFNEMTDALARRTTALEKAVSDLREANAELRRTRAGLDRAERLASVGRLAAGVAHEVGNPMGALAAFIDLSRRDPGLAPATIEHLERAAAQIERVRRILRQLLAFSRPGTPTARAPVDLLAAAEEAVALVQAQRRYAPVRFEVARDREVPRAFGDPGAATQILLNLLLNAADAVLPAGGGRVVVRVRPAALARRGGDAGGEEPARRRPDAVACVVADDGCGISEEDRERIFDPFFTTKDPGEGTGLGLSNSLRLAEEMGGALELVAPPDGLRTAFALRLPVEPPGATDGEGRSARACEARSGVRGPGARSAPVDSEKAL
jgi:two-component system NtrC family sensor kinase